MQHTLTAGVGASTVVAVAFAALALGCGLSPAEVLSAYAVAGTLTLLLAAV
jgi:hypothetical protein